MLETLPLELQAYILHYLPAHTLTRTLSLANHHFHDLVEAHVQRYCLRYLGLSRHATDPDSAAVLEFEAQRPIDTVTAKHTLTFSHFAPVSKCAYSGKESISSAAVFEFAEGSSSRVATDSERLRGARGSRGRGSSVSVGPERVRGAAGQGGYVATPFQPFLPGLNQDDQRRAAGESVVSSSLDLQDRRRERSVEGTSRARAIAQEIASAPFPFLRQSLEAANRHVLHRSSSNSSTTGEAQGYAAQGLEQPLDAYDWAGPPGTSAAPSRLPRRAADKPACYAFQLDPLDSFESLILTLTARRSVPDTHATIAAMLRGEEPAAHRLRYSKTLAEGLDRVFRDWFKPSAHTRVDPASQQLEFDNTSCTLTIQPHASPLAQYTHPALSTSSHDYLSRPPLSTQYANLASNERVELTFHCQHVTINAARLLATLERLEHDVLANQAKSKALGAGVRVPKIVVGTTAGVRVIPVGAAVANAGVGYFMVSQPSSAA